MSGIGAWLTVRRGSAPLILSIPHAGTLVLPEIETRLVSPWLARKDTDWWLDRLYGFAGEVDATIVRTAISRSVIDVNRHPTGLTLYPGQATTGLCPTESFDGEPLYRSGGAPSDSEVAARRALFYEPYHAALEAEIARLRTAHDRIVLYDCHSIRSVIPRLFTGKLPEFNVSSNDRASCDPALIYVIAGVCAPTGLCVVIDGRFKGGWITRHYGRPSEGIHAIQMELAIRGYMSEPPTPTADNWPSPWDPALAAPMRAVLARVLEACLAFAGRIPAPS